MTTENFLGLLFLCVSLFPWVGMPNLDSQPFAFLAGLIYISYSIIINRRSLGIPLLVIKLFYLLLIGVLLSILMNKISSVFLLTRGVINYIGIPIFLYSYLLFFKKYGFPIKILIFINFIYLISGVIQLINPDFFSSFIAMRTSVDRGVASLTPEPTYFGVMLYFFSWIYLIFLQYHPNRFIKFLIFLNILAVVFLAKSSMAVMFLIVSLILFFVAIVNYKNLIFLTFIFLIIINCFLYFLSVELETNNRLNFFLKTFFYSPLMFFEIDASANQRLGDIIFPLVGVLTNKFMPAGFFDYSDMVQKNSSVFENFFTTYVGVGKISSWLGSLIYEMGIFGVFAYWYLCSKAFNGTRSRFLELILITLLLFSSIPLALPEVYLIFATFLTINNYK